MSELQKLEKRVEEIKKILSPWQGMTWEEARKVGWTDKLSLIHI